MNDVKIYIHPLTKGDTVLHIIILFMNQYSVIIIVYSGEAEPVLTEQTHGSFDQYLVLGKSLKDLQLSSLGLKKVFKLAEG